MHLCLYEKSTSTQAMVFIREKGIFRCVLQRWVFPCVSIFTFVYSETSLTVTSTFMNWPWCLHLPLLISLSRWDYNLLNYFVWHIRPNTLYLVEAHLNRECYLSLPDNSKHQIGGKRQRSLLSDIVICWNKHKLMEIFVLHYMNYFNCLSFFSLKLIFVILWIRE